MSAHRVHLISENLPEQSFLQAIFLEEWRRGLVGFGSYLTPDGALSGAELHLLRNLGRREKQPIALVLNAGSRPLEVIARKRAAIGRDLSKISRGNWHVTLAIPKVDAWVLADPAVRAGFEADEATRDNRYEQSRRIREIAERRPIDRQLIAASHPEFVELAEYIREKTAVPQPTA
jgi:hypothetical protein